MKCHPSFPWLFLPVMHRSVQMWQLCLLRQVQPGNCSVYKNQCCAEYHTYILWFEAHNDNNPLIPTVLDEKHPQDHTVNVIRCDLSQARWSENLPVSRDTIRVGLCDVFTGLQDALLVLKFLPPRWGQFGGNILPFFVFLAGPHDLIRLESSLSQWKRGVLTTRPPGISWDTLL